MITGTHELWKTIDTDYRKDSQYCPCGLFLYRLKLPATLPGLSGKRWLFMSDFHLRNETVKCFPGKIFRNYNIDWLRQGIREAVAAVRPDFFIFGGDLIGSADV